MRYTFGIARSVKPPPKSLPHPLLLSNLVTLAIRLGGVVTLVHNQVLGPVILATAEVRVQDGLGTGGVALLGVERGTRHVWNSGVSAAPVDVRGVAEWVVLWCWLWEPHVTTVATELARLEGVSDILLDDNGTTGSVDEPRTYFTLAVDPFTSISSPTHPSSSWR